MIVQTITSSHESTSTNSQTMKRKLSSCCHSVSDEINFYQDSDCSTQNCCGNLFVPKRRSIDSSAASQSCVLLAHEDESDISRNQCNGLLKKFTIKKMVRFNTEDIRTCTVNDEATVNFDQIHDQSSSWLSTMDYNSIRQSIAESIRYFELKEEQDQHEKKENMNCNSSIGFDANTKQSEDCRKGLIFDDDSNYCIRGLELYIASDEIRNYIRESRCIHNRMILLKYQIDEYFCNDYKAVTTQKPCSHSETGLVEDDTRLQNRKKALFEANIKSVFGTIEIALEAVEQYFRSEQCALYQSYVNDKALLMI